MANAWKVFIEDPFIFKVLTGFVFILLVLIGGLLLVLFAKFVVWSIDEADCPYCKDKQNPEITNLSDGVKCCPKCRALYWKTKTK